MTPLEHAERNLAAQVGRLVVSDVGVIDERSVARFAAATGRAGAARDGDGITVSPLFLTATREWGVGSALAPDGTTTTDVGLPGHPDVRVMGGGQELELRRPVRVGSRVQVHAQVVELERKSGRSGPLLVAHIERRYLDEDGAVLVLCREARVMR